MSKPRKATVSVKGTDVTVLVLGEHDFISLTDIARHKEPDRSDHVIQNWIRNRNTIEFLGIWERLNNPQFKPLEFEGFRSRAGLNSFVLTPTQWIDATGAIQANLIPPEVTPAQAAMTYASEADVLNVAMFGHTAAEWRRANPDKKGNVRDYATVEQLLVLANIEGMNAELIHMGLSQGERLKRLNEIAIRQMRVLTAAPAVKQLR